MFARQPRSEDRRLPPAAVVGSAVIHVLLALLLARSPTLATTAPPDTYRVELVAMAPPDAPERLEPQPPEVEEEEHRPPPPEPTPEPMPETERPAVEEEQAPELEPTREPARAPEEGDEAVNVQLDGAVFPFPEYLDNIVRQIHRYWRPPTGGRAFRAELVFVIRRDGSVADIGWIQRSGDMQFDLEARGAVEKAGRDGAFGPLPDEYPRDRLRVSFFFDPSVR